MNTYRNAKFTKRNHDCTNVVACRAAAAPGAHWVECDESAIDGLMLLEIVAGVAFYGYL